MKLDFIDLGKLSVSKANMRYAKKTPDVSDILPTVRARGVLVPLNDRPAKRPRKWSQREHRRARRGQFPAQTGIEQPLSLVIPLPKNGTALASPGRS